MILISYILSLILTLIIVGFITAPIVWIVGMVMGYQDAQKWNSDHGIPLHDLAEAATIGLGGENLVKQRHLECVAVLYDRALPQLSDRFRKPCWAAMCRGCSNAYPGPATIARMAS